MNWSRVFFLSISLLFCAAPSSATIFGNIRGIVHDPSHRPIQGAQVALHAVASEWSAQGQTNENGEFSFAAVPAGEYSVRITHEGFAEEEQRLVVASGNVPVLHFQLGLAQQRQSVEVSETPEGVNPQLSTPETLVSRQTIEQ